MGFEFCDSDRKTIESNKISNQESNPFRNGFQHGTADADDGASVGYLMWRWEGYLRSGAVIAVIVTELEMHVSIYISIDVVVDIACL